MTTQDFVDEVSTQLGSKDPFVLVLINRLLYEAFFACKQCRYSYTAHEMQKTAAGAGLVTRLKVWRLTGSILASNEAWPISRWDVVTAFLGVAGSLSADKCVALFAELSKQGHSGN